MFRTMYDRDQLQRVNCCAGSGIKTEYQLRIDKDTKEEILEPVGKTSLYDYIQSHADSVDIHKILERCALLDDYSYLNRMPAQFMDLTEMPENLAEAHAMIQDAKNMFDRMPTSVKESYHNNFVEFISGIGSEKFYKVVGEYVDSIKKPVSDVVKEITEDEQKS